MRYVVPLLCAAVLACGQSVDTYTYNGTGERVRGPARDASDGSRTERMQSINGRSVPMEVMEEHVVRSDDRGKVVERIIRHYDATGNVAVTERVMEERTVLADGGSSVRATTYRSDASGNPQMVERSIVETRKSGGTETSDVVIERPSINGSLEVAERRAAVVEKSASGETSSTAVYLPDSNGRFYEAARETVERRKAGGETVENSATFTVGTSGRLELSSQTVKTSTKRQDGSESVVVDVYGAETPGRANASGTAVPQLKEQQVIERRTSGGQVTEVTLLRQASLDDPGRLGPARKVRETVCRGKCDE